MFENALFELPNPEFVGPVLANKPPPAVFVDVAENGFGFVNGEAEFVAF